MKHLLETSKQQLMNPLGQARRKLVIILNVSYMILLPLFLISEKLNTGKFVPETILLYVYGVAFMANLFSLFYNLSFVRKKLRQKYDLKQSTLERWDFVSGAASLIPILFVSTVNMLGVGNVFRSDNTGTTKRCYLGTGCDRITFLQCVFEGMGLRI
jgi:hypothetical protein